MNQTADRMLSDAEATARRLVSTAQLCVARDLINAADDLQSAATIICNLISHIHALKVAPAIDCIVCDGTGTDLDHDETDCDTCGGTGKAAPPPASPEVVGLQSRIERINKLACTIYHSPVCNEIQNICREPIPPLRVMGGKA